MHTQVLTQTHGAWCTIIPPSQQQRIEWLGNEFGCSVHLPHKATNKTNCHLRVSGHNRRLSVEQRAVGVAQEERGRTSYT